MGKTDPPVYVAADSIEDDKWILCAGTLSGFLQAALAYESVFAFPFHGEELMYWLTEEELETIRSGLERQPFGLYGWLGMDMSFYSNAPDNMAVIMDCGDLEMLYGAAGEMELYEECVLQGERGQADEKAAPMTLSEIWDMMDEVREDW